MSNFLMLKRPVYIFTNINVFMFHLQSNSYITESSQERALDAIMLWDVN